MQSYNFVNWLMQYPALSVMVVLRRDIGYRLLNPFILFATFGAVAFITVLATPGHEEARPYDLLIFCGIAFVNGIAQRIRRWWELNRGVQQHSYYIGSSPFDFRWLPNFVRRNRRVARYIDPVFCAGVGLALFPYSRALAIYLVFAGFCLKAYEYQVFDRERHRDLDMMDSLIVSEQQARTLEQYEQAKTAPQQQQPDAGVSTGLGDDLKKKGKFPKSSDPSLN